MRRHPILATIAAAALSLGGLAGLSAGPVLAATCVGSTSALQDGGFETPVIGAGNESQVDASLVPPWHTTDGANLIEIWGDGFNGVPAAVGTQFVEINATTAGTLYQDVVTVPGEMMTWTLQHRGRVGPDTMKVLIGDAATADVTSNTGWNYFSADLTDDTNAWGTHTAAYIVPAGQTCTRFGFRAVSSTGGDPSFGNFLDATGFQVAAPASPSPRPSVRATPPVTASLAQDPGPGTGTGPYPVVLLAMAVLGLAVGGWRVARRTKRTTG